MQKSIPILHVVGDLRECFGFFMDFRDRVIQIDYFWESRNILTMSANISAKTEFSNKQKSASFTEIYASIVEFAVFAEFRALAKARKRFFGTASPLLLARGGWCRKKVYARTYSETKTLFIDHL
jgi:hypothetical protein